MKNTNDALTTRKADQVIGRRAMLKLLGLTGSSVALTACSVALDPSFAVYKTTTLLDRTSMLGERSLMIPKTGQQPVLGDIVVDTGKRDQQFFGFGASLTDSAAYVLWTYLSADQRRELLTELYGADHGMRWSVVRVCLGDSDFTAEEGLHTYDDMPFGEFDPDLTQFSIARDKRYIVPILREIVEINPAVRIVGAPWFHPRWMLRDPASVQSGTNQLDEQYVETWAKYIHRAVQEYDFAGVPLYAVTPLNEPFITAQMTIKTHGMTAQFLKQIFVDSGVATLIFLGDDNWSRGGQVASCFEQYGVSAAGAAWHGYVGSAADQIDFRRRFPRALNIMTEFRSKFDESVPYTTTRMANLLVASLNAGTTMFNLWNLALDENGKPTPNSPGRRGVVTVPSDSSGDVVRNPEYYVLSQLSKALQPGAVRVNSTCRGRAYVANGDSPNGMQTPGDVISTAFTNPNGSVIVYCYNDAPRSQRFNISCPALGAILPVDMQPGEISTFEFSQV